MDWLVHVRGVVARNLQPGAGTGGLEGDFEWRGGCEGGGGGGGGETFLSLHRIGEGGKFDELPVYISAGRVERCNPSWLDVELGWGGRKQGPEAGGGNMAGGGHGADCVGGVGFRGGEFGVRLWRSKGLYPACTLLAGDKAQRGEVAGQIPLWSSCSGGLGFSKFPSGHLVLGV